MPFTVSAGAAGRSWAIGGVVPPSTNAQGRFFPFSHPSVAVWSAPDKRGPWKPDQLLADPQRDGPDETIHYAAIAAGIPVVFGWRNSPTEGYPRPSVWYASDPAATRWQEVVEPREFFGGPNVVGFGGLASGVHGAYVAGTWTNSTGGAIAAVWQSKDARTWSRVVLPNGRSDGIEIPFATGVADGPEGVLLIATAETPRPENPLSRRGVVWYSSDGVTWQRVLQEAITDRWNDSTFDSVVATQDGWIISGTVTTSAGVTATTWFVSGGKLTAITSDPLAATLPSGTNMSLSSTAADQDSAVVAATVGGRLRLWAAPLRRGRPGAWTSVQPPRSRLSQAESAEISISPSGAILLLRARLQTDIWTG